jgi:SAM-dependent methyltransferase
VRVQAVIADGHRLPFADGVFDAVWGVAILHHLELDRAGGEIQRVLKPEGVAVFCEPWGGNPALTFARKWLPYRGKERTRDEAPLSRRALDVFEKQFNSCRREHVQLLGMIRRAWAGFPLLSQLDRLDSHLLKRFPRLGQWSRYVVLTVRP